MARKKKKRPSTPQHGGQARASTATRRAPVTPVASIPVLPFWLPPVVVGATCAFVVWQLHPGLLFSSTTPTGGDLGGQVWGPAQLRNLILPNLAGWSPQWFGGLPVYVLYMPLPALAVVAFSVALPYGVALKLAVAISAVILPVAAWPLGRLSRLPEPIPACLAIAVIPFLFDDSYFQYGGNILSSVAGEYGYGLGVPVALVALGVLDVALRTGRWRATAVVLAAVASLCHPVIGLMVVIGGAFLITGHFLRLGVVAIRRAAPIVVLAPLIGAFWFLPFAWYRSELDPLNYSLGGGWTNLLFPLPIWAEIVIVGLATAGVVRAVRLRHPMTMMLVGMAAVCALAVLVLPRGLIGGWETQQNLAWVAGRMLPFWYLTLALLAGIGAGDLFLRASGLWALATTVGPLAGLLVAVTAIGVITGTLPLSSDQNVSTPDGLVTHSKWLFLPEVETSLVPLWVTDGFGGYEREPEWPQYHALMDQMAKLGETDGCGRAIAENDPSGTYGSIFEFSLLPYWTKGCIDLMYGVPEDQSRNFTYVDLAQSMASWYRSVTVQPGVTYQGLDLRQGVPLLRELGVHYYTAYTPEAKSEAASDPDLTHLASSGQWAIYEVRDVSMVQALTNQPVVVPAAAGDALRWLDDTAPWYLGATPGARPAAGGPSGWARVSDPSIGTPGRALPPVAVSHVVLGRNSVSFHVSRTGVPVEVRLTYFPWWEAKNADGPWRLAPDDLVVVPTGHDVVLTAQPRLIDRTSLVVSVLAVLATIALARWDRRRRRQGVSRAGVRVGASSPPSDQGDVQQSRNTSSPVSPQTNIV